MRRFNHLKWLTRALGVAALSASIAACIGDVESEGEEHVGSDSEAISNGNYDPSNRTNDAVIKLSTGCSGTLITPQIVLTAGHCVSGRAPRPATASPRGDWETRGQWYNLSTQHKVRFGNDAAGLKANGYWAVPQAVFTIEGPAAGSAIRSGDDISFRTSGGFYVVAEEGGGSYVGADRTVARDWERFGLTRLAGAGLVRSGDTVALQANDNKYIASELYRNGELEANRTRIGAWEQFTVDKVSGSGVIRAGDSVTIRANNNGRLWLARNGGGGGWRYEAVATQYNMPVDQDIMMLRLSAPVPSWVATPIPVLTRQPAAAQDDAYAFWDHQTVRMVGWGIDENGKLPRYRQTGWAFRTAFPFARWGADTNFIAAYQTDGALTQPGDSGSPLLWTDARGKMFVLGALQGGERYVSTMGVGTSMNNDRNTPNVATWAELVLGIRDCASMSRPLTIARRSGRYVLLNGDHQIMSFDTVGQAQHARRVVGNYGMDEMCYLNRPQSEFFYALTRNRLPGGVTFAGETCRRFSSAFLDVTGSGDNWALRDIVGRVILKRFDTELAARHSMGLLRDYGASSQCFFDGAPVPGRWTGAGSRVTYYKR